MVGGVSAPFSTPPSPAVVPLVVEATVLEQVAAARVPVAAGAVAAADGRRWSGGWHLWRVSLPSRHPGGALPRGRELAALPDGAHAGAR